MWRCSGFECNEIYAFCNYLDDDDEDDDDADDDDDDDDDDNGF